MYMYVRIYYTRNTLVVVVRKFFILRELYDDFTIQTINSKNLIGEKTFVAQTCKHVIFSRSSVGSC